MPVAPASSIGPAGAKKGFHDGAMASAMNPIPHELAIGGVYLPPLLIAALLGAIAAVMTARLLNRYRLSRYFFYPPLVFPALMIIYTVAIGTFITGM
jgi:hypothetical protein